MKKSLFILFLLPFLWSCSKDYPIVVMETTEGNIEIQVYPDKAPVTAENFLRYVDEKRYDKAAFYRVVRPDNQPQSKVKIEVIQGGIDFLDEVRTFAPIEHENTNMTGIKHKNGVISMARYTPGTATSEFFICIGDQPELDFKGKRNPDGHGFAAFGKVIHGMDVVEKIQNQKAEGQSLLKRVSIEKIYRKSQN